MHGRGRASGEPREIAARLGVARARQHAAGCATAGKTWPGLHDIVGRASRRDGDAHRVRAIGGRDAVVTPLAGLDRHGDIRAVRRAI
jgi:hypothetical protein